MSINHLGGTQSEKERELKDEITMAVAKLIKMAEGLLEFVEAPIESLFVSKIDGTKGVLRITKEYLSDEEFEEYYKKSLTRAKDIGATTYDAPGFYERAGVKRE